jgi:hypothetical protein
MVLQNIECRGWNIERHRDREPAIHGGEAMGDTTCGFLGEEVLTASPRGTRFPKRECLAVKYVRNFSQIFSNPEYES